MKRGELWTAADGSGYASKPRPVVIVQSDDFEGMDSVTICGFTSQTVEAPLLRIPIQPTRDNGLRETSSLMADKLMTIRRDGLGQRIGQLAPADMDRLSRALIVFLGLAGVSSR